MKILVVGAGLIGGSIGLALKQAGHTVQIDDLSDSSTEAARKATLLEDLVDSPEVVFVAVPTDATAKVICSAISTYPRSIVIDVASIKTEVVSEVEALCGKSVNFVPSHPMSGKELSGAVHASFDLFQDRIWVLTPNDYTAQDALKTATQLVEDCGSLPIVMNPETHDRTVALTSHLPQVLSSVLARHIDSLSNDAVKVSGQGLRDMTRLAASNAELWSNILSSNANFVSPLMNDVANTLHQFAHAIDQHDISAISQFLQSGNDGRKKVPGKHGAPAIEYAVVSILIDDKPGQLAGIFQTAGTAEINIEDVRIDHSLGKEQAVIELHVKPDSANALTKALKADGWVIRSSTDSE